MIFLREENSFSVYHIKRDSGSHWLLGVHLKANPDTWRPPRQSHTEGFVNIIMNIGSKDHVMESCHYK